MTGVTDRENKTVPSPSRIIFCTVEPTAQNIGLLKGIPTEPIQQRVDQPVVFGRGHSAGLFLNDETVSREHMKLFVQTNPVTDEKVFVVETVSNTKPVYINGRPLHKQAGMTVLQTNDKLTIGMLEFTVTVMPGDSVEFYQVEFTKSGRNPQQCYLQQSNNPIAGMPPRGAVNAEQIIMANQLGAVIIPSNFGMPGNPAFNMNISSSGGVSSQMGPMIASQQHPFQQPPPYYGMPAATSYQQIPGNFGMDHSVFQQHPAHHRFQDTAFYPQHPEASHPGMYRPFLHPQVPAQERRQMYQTKQPSEHSEDSKENGHCDAPHIPVQETGLSKPHT